MIAPMIPHCGICGWPYQSGAGFQSCTCGTTPAGATPAPAAPNPAAPIMPATQTAPGRFVQRGGYEVCVVCGFAKAYCPGHAPAEEPGPDGSDLARRIAEARAKAGGR